jgi:hypothetical protein
MGDPQRIRQAGNDMESKPMPTEGWEDEQAYNDYVSGIITQIPQGRRTPQIVSKIEELAEMGAWGSLTNLLSQKGFKAAGSYVRQNGGQAGPDTWVDKGFSVIGEDGKFHLVDEGESKTLTSLQDEYDQTHDRTQKGYYKNAPTREGHERVLNDFGKFGPRDGR